MRGLGGVSIWRHKLGDGESVETTAMILNEPEFERSNSPVPLVQLKL